MDDGEIIKQIVSELGTIAPGALVPPETLSRTRESLDEVKALTEYEDEKATRILTIVTIFGALAGLIFTRIADQYPLLRVVTLWGRWNFQTLLVIANYALFGMFVLFTVSGALVIFHATRVRFKYPSLPTPGGVPAPVKSHLFFKEILQVTPQSWARAFLSRGAPGQVSGDIGTEYFKNHIVESYLIAAKVGDKLRYLMPAQSILAWAMRILLVWLAVYAVTLVVVPEVPKPPAPAQIVFVNQRSSAPIIKSKVQGPAGAKAAAGPSKRL